jgi:Uma2 family endonuclease
MGADAPTDLRLPETMATAFSCPPFAGRRYTIDEIDQLFARSDLRVELLDGHLLVSPSPSSRHQALCERLCTTLSLYATPMRLGRVFSPGTILYQQSVEFQPDVLVTPWSRRVLPWREVTEWWLAVEVLSHSTREIDLGSKRSCYLQMGVKELWLVDPDAPRISVVRPGLADTLVEPPAMLTWQPWPPLAPPLTIDLAELFADA